MKYSKGDILVPRDSQFSDGAIVVTGYDDSGRLLAHPLGGGFQKAFAAEVTNSFRLADAGERERALFHYAKYSSLMHSEDHFTGWTNGEFWNGWAMPHFEFAESQRLIDWQEKQNAMFKPAEGNSSNAAKAHYDTEPDAFITMSPEGEEEVWAVQSIGHQSLSCGRGFVVLGLCAGGAMTRGRLWD